MNCKEGDMAIIVRSIAGNEGKIVTCLKFVPNYECLMSDLSVQTRPAWIIDRYLPSYQGRKINIAIDEWLRPIRPGDLHETTDERKEVTA